MKLIRLKANKSSFHTVEFHDGLNIIVGKQSRPNNENDGKTYNGVGKSLIIHLIHYCLGSNKIEAFSESLKDWEFTLDYHLNGIDHSVTRSVNNQSKIILDNEEIKLSEFRSILLEDCFGLRESEKYLTWNSLFSRFARRYRTCYTSFDSFTFNEQDYSKLINNAYLLGLDINLIVKKKELRDKQQSAKTTEKAIKSDPLFRQYYLGDHDAESDVIELERSIDDLEHNISTFKVSNNYHEIEVEADELSYKKRELENERTLTSNNVKSIESALSETEHVETEKVLKMYESAQVEIPGMVKHSIDEVVAFHNQLIETRNQRLTKELQKQKARLSELEKNISTIGIKMDSLLGYLDTHGALDEYSSLSSQLLDLKSQLNHINEYKKIMNAYQDADLEIKAEMIAQDRSANEYLTENEKDLSILKTTFYELAKSFYPFKRNGLLIKNNSGENTLRYNIDAWIEDDSSDGVNEVRVFCFDMLLFTRKVSSMGFIIHDSRLFSNMDPRQRSVLFEVADRLCHDNGLQYICTINEDALLSAKNILGSEKANTIIDDNIVLQLNDESSSSKLLGVQVDMNLEVK